MTHESGMERSRGFSRGPVGIVEYRRVVCVVVVLCAVVQLYPFKYLPGIAETDKAMVFP
jgi:hypothetical protein